MINIFRLFPDVIAASFSSFFFFSRCLCQCLCFQVPSHSPLQAGTLLIKLQSCFFPLEVPPSPAPLPPLVSHYSFFFFFPNYVHYYRTFHFRGQKNGGDTKKKKNVAIWPAYQDQSVLHRYVKHRRTLHSRCCTNNEPKLKRKAFLPPPPTKRGPAPRSWRLSYGQLDASIQ